MTEKRQRPGGRAAAVRQAVRNAARELYASGKALPSLTEIAAKAGVQRSTLYRRWGNAQAVILDAVGRDIQKSIRLPDTGSLREDLLEFVRASHRFHRSSKGRNLVAMLLGSPDDVKQAYWKTRYALLQSVFENAVRRKEIASQPDWSFYLDLLTAPWYFCAWGKAEAWPLESAERAVSLICASLSA